MKKLIFIMAALYVAAFCAGMSFQKYRFRAALAKQRSAVLSHLTNITAGITSTNYSPSWIVTNGFGFLRQTNLPSKPKSEPLRLRPGETLIRNFPPQRRRDAEDRSQRSEVRSQWPCDSTSAFSAFSAVQNQFPSL